VCWHYYILGGKSELKKLFQFQVLRIVLVWIVGREKVSKKRERTRAGVEISKK
jgi:hypothetical protein